MLKEVKELLDEVRMFCNDIKKKLASTYDLVQAMLNLEYDADALKISGTRFTIDSGGYKVIGNRVYVELALTANTALGGNDYWTMLTGLPAPAGGRHAALAAARDAATAPMNAYTYNGSLVIILGNQSLASGAKIAITGSYIMDGGVHPNPLKSLFQRRCLLWHCL